MTQAPATHDEWIELMNNSVSDFARTQIAERFLAEAATGDYMARLYVASEVQHILRLEAKTDAELAAELAECEADHLRYISECDYSEYDIDDRESHHAHVWLIRELQGHRAAVARYTGHGPLTHSPFAGLKVA